MYSMYVRMFHSICLPSFQTNTCIEDGIHNLLIWQLETLDDVLGITLTCGEILIRSFGGMATKDSQQVLNFSMYFNKPIYSLDCLEK